MREITCQEVRILMQAKAILIRSGADARAVSHLNRLRDVYVRRVGLATYLSQMLTSVATIEARQCVLGWRDGRVADQESFRGEGNRPVQRYIRAHYRDDLPCVVEALIKGRVEVRYL